MGRTRVSTQKMNGPAAMSQNVFPDQMISSSACNAPDALMA